MNEDLSILFDRIRTLLNHQGDGVPTPRTEEVEHTLTDGYARALALEGERLRAERRIRALAGDAEHLTELQALTSRLRRLDADLAQLRDLLRGLAATLSVSQTARRSRSAPRRPRPGCGSRSGAS